MGRENRAPREHLYRGILTRFGKSFDDPTFLRDAAQWTLSRQGDNMTTSKGLFLG